jgi:hypothetical protein
VHIVLDCPLLASRAFVYNFGNICEGGSANPFPGIRKDQIRITVLTTRAIKPCAHDAVPDFERHEERREGGKMLSCWDLPGCVLTVEPKLTQRSQSRREKGEREEGERKE